MIYKQWENYSIVVSEIWDWYALVSVQMNEESIENLLSIWVDPEIRPFSMAILSQETKEYAFSMAKEKLDVSDKIFSEYFTESKWACIDWKKLYKEVISDLNSKKNNGKN